MDDPSSGLLHGQPACSVLTALVGVVVPLCAVVVLCRCAPSVGVMVVGGDVCVLPSAGRACVFKPIRTGVSAAVCLEGTVDWRPGLIHDTTEAGALVELGWWSDSVVVVAVLYFGGVVEVGVAGGMAGLIVLSSLDSSPVAEGKTWAVEWTRLTGGDM